MRKCAKCGKVMMSDLRLKVWGIGLSMTDPKRLEPSLWRGQNLLGFALMMVRKKLK